MRLPPPPAHTLGQIEHAVDASGAQRIEHRPSPSEADGLVAARAERLLQRLDRFDRVELFEVVAAGGMFRLQVVGESDAHVIDVILTRSEAKGRISTGVLEILRRLRGSG